MLLIHFAPAVSTALSLAPFFAEAFQVELHLSHLTGLILGASKIGAVSQTQE